MELKRNPHNLSQTEYDLLVIGGGIYGACVAWDATLRGLSVAIVEQADFASATSANSLKIIHGGFRYLQSADIRRMRESVRERRTLMRIAPHLVHPLPVLIPTFKRLMQRKEILTFAMMINDVIGFDRNRGSESQKRIPRSRMVSRSEVARTLPGLGERGVTGGVLVYDAQVYNSERLVISFLRSAAEAGAELCNYMQVTGFLRNGDSVIGVKAQDTLTGDEIEIRAKAVVNTSGPWFNRVLGLLGEHQSSTEASFATAMNIVIGRQLFEDYAVGIPSRRENGDASGNESNQYLFVSPWRGRSLIGTAYSQYTGRPEDLKFTEQDIQSFLNEVNSALPEARLHIEDVSLVHGGLLPRNARSARGTGVQLTDHYRLHDHRKDGINGLISVLGVKYTTARDVAEKAVDMVFKALGYRPPQSASSTTPLFGGNIERFDDFMANETAMRRCGLDADEIRRLVLNYGSAYPRVLSYVNEPNEGTSSSVHDDLLTIKAEVLHAIREEMAQKLGDVVFRRTEIGSAGHPGDIALKTCARTMAEELGWNDSRLIREVQEVEERFALSGLAV